MKETYKIIMLCTIMLLVVGMVSALAPYCGDLVCYCDYDYCELDGYPDECLMDCSSCEDRGLRTEVECLGYCEGLGMIDPEDCEALPLAPSRSEVDDFCRGYGYIRSDDCPDSELMDCDETACTESGFITYDSCPKCTNNGYERCNSCCPVPEESYTFQWWLLIIGAVIGWLIHYLIKRRRK